MEDKNTGQSAGSQDSIDVPETVQEEARTIIRGAFRLFADHTQRMADDMAEFNQKRSQVQENVAHGARRTTGRIV